MDYTLVNAETIDRWVEEGWEWGVPLTHEEYLRAKDGDWKMLLTPVKPVPKAWFPPLRGCRQKPDTTRAGVPQWNSGPWALTVS